MHPFDPGDFNLFCAILDETVEAAVDKVIQTDRDEIWYLVEAEYAKLSRAFHDDDKLKRECTRMAGVLAAVWMRLESEE
jgi:hypothetical protein